ncbi:type IV pilus assembly protein PilQ [Parelusimicrobium proximum]|uniref:secretin N-terminal domain-containing protein n=1 Tax=Parelusimicrobium proximum TaxID=3228953 RepID=UPI003D17DE3D
MSRSFKFLLALCAAVAVSAEASAQGLELPKDDALPPVPTVSSSGGFTKAREGGNAIYKDDIDSALDTKVSIRVSSLPLASFLNSISAQTKVSFIMGEEFAKNRVTATLTNVPAREALDTILKIHGLTYQRIGKTDSYVVTRRSSDAPDVVTKVYTLNYISLQNDGGGAGSTGSSQVTPANTFNSQGQITGSSINTAPTSDQLFEEYKARGASGNNIMSIIQSTLSKQGKVAVDPRTNKIIITDVPEVFPQLENLIAELDIKPPQILIEAQIVEVNKTSGLTLGLEYGGSDGTIFSFTGPSRTVDIDYLKGGVSGWGYIFPDPPVGSGSSGGSSSGSSGSSDSGSSGEASDAFLDFSAFQIVLRSLLTRGEAKFLGKPKVVTLNNQAAKIESTRDAAISNVSNLSGNSSSGSSSSNIVTTQAERQEVGLTLSVTPQVNRDGYITLMVEPEYSDVAASSVPGSYDPIKRKASTLVRVKNGQTVVLGGLLSSRETQQVRKVPLLGDIPILGWLFTSKTSSKETTDMVIFITPTILAD